MGTVARHVGVLVVHALAAACLLIGFAAPAHALVHMAGDGSGNTTPPPDDPGFTHVGAMNNGLSGIYLGLGWVLTAAHVSGPQAITLAGVTYPAVPGSWVVLEHSSGVDADLAMQRISGTPPLASLPISASPPNVGDSVTMIGRGWVRQPSQTCWNNSFIEISCSPGPVAFRGFKQLVGAFISPRWGRNLVTDVGVDVPEPGSMTRAFEVEFDTPGLTEEAQAVVGDSGGGVFLKRGTQWQLAGVLFTISTYMDQPSGTAVYGDRTYSIDLSYYRNQIIAHMVPPQIPVVPWPALPLVAGALAGVARIRLSGRRPAGTAARRG